MKKLKRRAKQRRHQLNHEVITFGSNKLRGRELLSVDEKGRVVCKNPLGLTLSFNKLLGYKGEI